MANNNNVLYQRDEDGDSDAWDDTVLIKAYDNAVSAMKAKLAAEHPEYSKMCGAVGKKKKKSKQKAKKTSKKSSVSKPSYNWKVGDICQAVFTEDNEVYTAQILSLNVNGTCLVRYVDYGNEEEQFLESLLPASSEPSSQDNKTDTASEADSAYEVPKGKHSGRRKSNNRGTFVGGQTSNSSVPPWNWNSFAVPQPPPPSAPHQFPGFPHPPCFPPSSFGSAHQFPPMFPGMPPPPPMLSSLDKASEDESMYSMLISWYMSGYHTGYYQGMKNAKSSFNGPHR